MKVIFSLTSIPPRFERVQPVLQSLQAQGLSDYEIRLYIPKSFERFPEYDGTMPSVPEGVKIIPMDQDFGPASKILNALQDFHSHQEQVIIYCDDDQIYPKTWAQKLLITSQARPDDAICVWGKQIDEITGEAVKRTVHERPRAEPMRRAQDWRYLGAKFQNALGVGERPRRTLFRKSGFVDIAMGVGGVLVKPRFFDEDAFEIDPSVRFVDDVWLSANLCKNNVGLWLTAGMAKPIEINGPPEDSLYRSDFGGQDRTHLDRAAVEFARQKFGIWQQR